MSRPASPDWNDLDTEMHNTLSIHVDIADAATREEADRFMDELCEWIGAWMEANPDRGTWDPFVHSHTQSCEESDHCYGPGSWAAKRIAAEVSR